MRDLIWTLLPIVAVAGTAWAVYRARNLPPLEVPPPPPPLLFDRPPLRKMIVRGREIVEPTAAEMYDFKLEQWRLTRPDRYVHHEEHRAFLDRHRT